ncbi:MAG: hypothetical protein EOO88_49290 [Pedobacter sp.]|nr:MAG: hypothetical protein EOO88_49290 [Pedobacter sp.]
MATLIVKVDDERTESLKKILSEIPYVHGVREDDSSGYHVSDPESTYERIKRIQEEIGDQKLFENIKDPSEWRRNIEAILDKAKGKNLFNNIDPSEWQREIRNEWDRDFTIKR